MNISISYLCRFADLLEFLCVEIPVIVRDVTLCFVVCVPQERRQSR